MIRQQWNKEIAQCTNEELYEALLLMVKEKQAQLPRIKGKKKLYYVSAEFLIGKLLSNNLINLGLFDEIQQELSEVGKNLSQLEEFEHEPSLGNGGLGRLAACFMDSIATLGLPGDGIGLNYHYGLFHQIFEDHQQKELPNPWIMPQSWLQKTPVVFSVPFQDFTVESVLYDIDVTGYHNGQNKLHLFDLKTLDLSMVKEGIQFDKTDIAHNLTLFLYPDDSDEAGRLLRVYQQYFMVSNAAQFILYELEERGFTPETLAQHAVIQINDTHPSLIIPELIRLLQLRGISMEQAITIVSNTCAYTNHTILSEALEKWPLSYLETVVPQLVPIIKTLDKIAKEKTNDEALAIIDSQNRVHMAHMDIHYGFSVNGVAALHTEILKQSELSGFYKMYPEKFNNKTNGITFRRWLMHCNPALCNWITEKIGETWKTDANNLQQLMQYSEDEHLLSQLKQIKQNNKNNLVQYLQEQGITVDANSIFDIQIKRLHEYKRQQMNALYIIWKYQQIKAGHLPQRPITFLFGAKAAPAYTLAKDIIHLMLCLQTIIEADAQVNPWLRIVMVENYNVTKAEKLIPACDVSEQISLASKEASGTGNMKFMLNGAITLGTMDGANVEIHNLVKEDNIYIFGKSSEEVIELYAKKAYDPIQYYRDTEIEPLVDFIIGKELLQIGQAESLCRIYKNLVTKDWFMTLLDLKDYIKTKEKTFAAYEDTKAWSKKMLCNIAQAGYFSSDRTIKQYNEDIWHL